MRKSEKLNPASSELVLAQLQHRELRRGRKSKEGGIPRAGVENYYGESYEKRCADVL